MWVNTDLMYVGSISKLDGHLPRNDLDCITEHEYAIRKRLHHQRSSPCSRDPAAGPNDIELNLGKRNVGFGGLVGECEGID